MFEKIQSKKFLFLALALIFFICSAFICLVNAMNSDSQPQTTNFNAPLTTVTESTSSTKLDIFDFTFDGLALSFQWYKIESDSNGNGKIDINDNGTPISGANNAEYETPDTLSLGKHYYYLELKLVSAKFDVYLKSDLITVDIKTSGQENTLSFLNSKMNISKFEGLSYQWYEVKDSNSDGKIDTNDNPTLISGATGAVYETPNTLSAGKYYYYVELTFKNNEKVKSDFIIVEIKTIGEQKTLKVFDYDANGILKNATLTYQWYQSITTSSGTSDINPISGAAAASYTTSSGLNSGLYKYILVLSVTADNSFFKPTDFIDTNFTSNTISIKVNPLPLLEANEGGSVNLNFYFEEAVYPWQCKYQWYKNNTSSKTGGEIIPEATNENYSIPKDLAPGNHYYYVILTMNGSQLTSEVFTVKIHAIAKAPVISNQPENITITNRSTQTVSVTATSPDGGALSYQWLLNGSPIKGATDSTYELNGLIDLTGKHYTLQVEVTNTLVTANGTSTAKIESEKITVTQAGLNINGIVIIILSCFALAAIGGFVTYKIIKKKRESR